MTEIQSANLDEYEGHRRPFGTARMAKDRRTADARELSEIPQDGRSRRDPLEHRGNGGRRGDESADDDRQRLVLEDGTGHPRTSGTFSKVLGRYVREARSLSLMGALRKMTLMPAQRLEARVAAMKMKGRIRVGADADITIFDAARVIDRSTYREPGLPPVGIRHVIVNGVAVVSNEQLVDGVFPGRAIRASDL